MGSILNNYPEELPWLRIIHFKNNEDKFIGQNPLSKLVSIGVKIMN